MLGYAPDGLPLYNTTQAKSTASVLDSARTVLRSIFDNRDTKQIFMFLSINFGEQPSSVMVIENKAIGCCV